MAEPITHAPVLVTGASGFVATHIVEQLLAGGYSVRGTVRDPDKARRQGYLTGLDRAQNLELVSADLLTPGAFNDAVQGCEYVIHTASPYVLTVKDPQRDLVDPAVRGTLSVLEACSAAPSVKRVVLTSSVVAMVDAASDERVDEETWNTTSTLKRNPYHLSKTLAERAAWDFIKEQNTSFDLVVINPSAVLGPEHSDQVNLSVRMLADMTTTKSPVVLDLPVGIVDVRDVARAHVAAIETDDASGRYLCAAHESNLTEIVAFMEREFPDMRRPRIKMDGALGTRVIRVLALAQPSGLRWVLRDTLGGTFRLDNSKIQSELGVQFRPLNETLRDTFDDLIASGKIHSSSP